MAVEAESTRVVQLSIKDAAVLHYAAWVFTQLGFSRSSKYTSTVGEATYRLEKQLRALAGDGAEFPRRCVECGRRAPMVAPHVCWECYGAALRRIDDGDVAVCDAMTRWPPLEGTE